MCFRPPEVDVDMPTCPFCNATVSSFAKTCPSCGKPLKGEGSAPAPAAPGAPKPPAAAPGAPGAPKAPGAPEA